jgi:small subunit ribosomal protein S3
MVLGQKTHPTGFRLGVIKTWSSRWYAGRDFGLQVVEDRKIRDYVKKKLEAAGVSQIEIERAANKVKLRIHTARPGIVIGKKGADIEILRKEVENLIRREVVVQGEHGPENKPLRREVLIDIQEVRKPEISAQLVAEAVAQQLQRRVAFRRAMKKSISLAFKFGALGVKIHCAGRLGGAEMARREWYREGRVPLHTLRADVDYGFAEAHTTYGVIGVKAWIFKGEVLDADTPEAF